MVHHYKSQLKLQLIIKQLNQTIELIKKFMLEKVKWAYSLKISDIIASNSTL